MKPTFWGQAQLVKGGMRVGVTLELPVQGTLERLILPRQYEASRVHITRFQRDWAFAVISSRVVGLEKVRGCFRRGGDGGQDPAHSMQGALSFSGLCVKMATRGG